MNIRELQAALGIRTDGVRGPVTTAEILKAADDGRLSAIARVPAPVTGAATVKESLTAEITRPKLPWIDEGRKVYGLHEVKDNAALRKWLISDNKTLGDPAALPWCGDFVETCIKRALPAEPFVGAMAVNPYWARNWVTFGEACEPSYGCIVVFERGPSSGHVGFAIGQDATHFFVLGGNQGDRVGIAPIAKDRLLASRWPMTWPNDPGPLPAMVMGTMGKVREF